MKLTKKVIIYIPSRQCDDKLISNRTMIISDTRKKLAATFGGSTSIQSSIGTWILRNGSPQHEQIEQVYAYPDNVTDNTKRVLKRYASKLKRICNQESIAYEIDNNLFLI